MRSSKRYRSAYLILGISLTLTAVAWYFADQTVNMYNDFKFSQKLNEVETTINFRIQTYINALAQTRGFFYASNNVSRQEFAEYIETIDLKEKYPGIQGVGFSQRLPRSRVAAHEQQIQKTGYPDYEVWPIEGVPEVHSIVYLEPFDWRNRRAFGYNMFSEPTRREAMVRARDTGRPSATGIVTLVQETDVATQKGFLIYLPFYDNQAPRTLEERRESLIGYIYSPFRAEDFFNAALADAHLEHIKLEAYLGDKPSEEALIYSSRPVSAQEMQQGWEPSHKQVVSIHMAGQELNLRFTTLPEFYGLFTTLLPAGVILLGLLISGVTFRIIWINIRRGIELAQKANENSKLYADAERANRMKDEFLATLSHELRTPLNVILGWVDVLQSEPYEQETYYMALQTLERNAKVQVELINDLLDVSKIISGKLVLNPQPTSLKSVVSVAVDSVQPAAQAKEIGIVCQVDNDIPEMKIDPDRIQQVLWNLLSNAVKFTPQQGEVKVLVRRKNEVVEIEVSDTGKGIDPEFLPYVFERFRQEEIGTTRSPGGLGLGLAISRYLVESHGGDISVASRGRGQGTTFVIHLPFNARIQPEVKSEVQEESMDAGTEPVQLEEERKKLDHLSILLVDDSPDVLSLVTRLLERQGAEISAATSAKEAFEYYQKRSPDLIISDIGMPEEDGYSLIRRIRETEKQEDRRHVPAIALTAYARKEDAERALKAGFELHLAKPIAREPLTQAVIDVTDSQQQAL